MPIRRLHLIRYRSKMRKTRIVLRKFRYRDTGWTGYAGSPLRSESNDGLLSKSNHLLPENSDQYLQKNSWLMWKLRDLAQNQKRSLEIPLQRQRESIPSSLPSLDSLQRPFRSGPDYCA